MTTWDAELDPVEGGWAVNFYRNGTLVVLDGMGTDRDPSPRGKYRAAMRAAREGIAYANENGRLPFDVGQSTREWPEPWQWSPGGQSSSLPPRHIAAPRGAAIPS